nr:cathepsin L-like proteinase [Leptinotarsa decemlineata]
MYCPTKYLSESVSEKFFKNGNTCKCRLVNHLGNYSKTYKSLREEKFRFNIFQEKLREIKSHNEKYKKREVSYFLRVNQFSDLTTEEFAKMLNRNLANKPNFQAIRSTKEIDDNLTVPEFMNWVQKGAVLEVKDQGHCQSCWAFSTTGSIEGQNIIRHNKRLALSEQQLVDCSRENNGCKGGLMGDAFNYVQENGLASESAYPYTGVQRECKKAVSSVNIKGFTLIEGGEDSLQKAVGTIGPISVAVEATLWQSYGGGVFDNPNCTGFNLNHGTLSVGYGIANEKEYWLIKNSWGVSWGEEGYIRLVRNKYSQCGIDTYATYPRM